MSLLTNTTDAATTAANQVRQIVRQQFQQLANSGTQGFNLIWKNRQATPEEVIAALGIDAKAVFQLAQLNISTITSAADLGGVAAPAVPSIPSQYSVAFNQDGSATVRQMSSSSAGGN